MRDSVAVEAFNRQRDGDFSFRNNLIRHRLSSLSLSQSKQIESQHSGSINSLSLDSVESRYLLAAAADSSVVAYDVATIDEGQRGLFKITRANPEAHKFSVTSAIWYPIDTGLFVTGSNDSSAKVWDSNLLQTACTFELAAPVQALAMSGCATGHCLVAVAIADPTIKLCDPNSGSLSHTLSGHREKVLCVAWSVLNEWELVSGGADGQARLWDIRRAGCINAFDQHNTRRAPAVSGRRRASRAEQRAQHLASATAHEGSVTGLLPTPDGLFWVTAGTDSRIRLWNSDTSRNQLVNYDKSFNRSIKSRQLAFAEERRLLFHPSGSVVQGYDLLTGELEFVLRGHMDAVNACCYNDALQELYTGSNDRQICVWAPASDSGERDRDSWSP